MGIVNATPDSFSDGGAYADAAAAAEAGADMAAQGAAIIDVGGESTRPGASDGVGRRRDRAGACRSSSNSRRAATAVSIDTRKSGVMTRGARGGGGDGQRRVGADLGPAIGRGRRQRRRAGRADAPPGRPADDAGRRRATTTCWSRFICGWRSGSRQRKRRASRATRSWSIPASASARRSRTISS